MGNIFSGYLFIFLNFNLTIGNCTIGLIPTFVGYIFMVKGLRELSDRSAQFKKIRPLAIGMGIFSGLLYLGDLFGVAVNLGGIGILLGLASTVISLYIAYAIIQGIQDIEAFFGADLNSAKLKSAWTLMAIFQGLTYISLFYPVLTVICILVSSVFVIVFLVAFHTAKKRYEALPAEVPQRMEEAGGEDKDADIGTSDLGNE